MSSDKLVVCASQQHTPISSHCESTIHQTPISFIPIKSNKWKLILETAVCLSS